MTQREATVGAILSVLANRDVEYVLGGETTIAEVLIDADKKQVREILIAGFMSEEIDMKPESKAKYLTDSTELKKYVSGLLNNWIRKYKPFNNGQEYKAKNPGSRAHSQDEQLKELKKLSAMCNGDAEAMAKITEAIVKRKAEIEAEKAKDIEIKIDALPEHLKHLVKS